jgi:uncharacterized protein with NRDE domain
MFQVVADAPLIMAANRDERYARPAVAMTTLRGSEPRILGGRDELAGGTWLAVSSRGLVAGLTNQPLPAGQDATKRSRGELPLAFAAHRSAREAVTAVCAGLDPAAYNPCWLLVGDRHSLFSVGLTGGARPEVEELPAGLHVLENAPLRAPSAKTAQVTRMVTAERAARLRGPGLTENAATAADALTAVLRDHRPAVGSGTASPAGPGGPAWPPALSAACVHTPEYGTRSALIATVPAAGPPLLRLADGPPCVAPFQDVTGWWTAPALA